MVSRLRSLSVCVFLVGYSGLAVEHRHAGGWWWYALIFCGMATYYLLSACQKR